MVRLTRTLLSTVADPPEAVTVESDFVVILAALLCALICTVGLIAVARCAWLRRGGTGRSSSLSAANKGLKKKVLQSLPKYTYSSGTTSATAEAGGGVQQPGCTKFGSNECSICLGEFSDGDEIRVLPQCGHCFHVGCIDTWLTSHSSCPSCRQILVVARCQKCGHLPAAASAANSSSACGGGDSRKVEVKASSSCGNNHVPVGGFLP